MNPRLVFVSVASLLLGTAAGAVAATSGIGAPFGDLLGSSSSGGTLLSLGVALLLVGGLAAFALEMRRVAHHAVAHAAVVSARAAEQEEQAQETLELLDTSTMLAAAEDLETTLNIALIRLADLVPYDICALLLYDPDTGRLQLAHGAGLSGDGEAAVHTLPMKDRESLVGAEAGTRLWPRIGEESPELGVLANLDPATRSVIVAPLRPLPLLEFLGLIYVGAHEGGRLTERHRHRVDQFARYAAFHIQQKRLQDRFRMQARTDAMTGLDNYRSFRQRLEEEAQRARRYNRPLSLILLDLDHFKRINDTYLHLAGDAILRQMAAVLRGILRGSDVAARYGGEEMAIICPETAGPDARTLAERIRATVAGHRFLLPVSSGVHEIEITVSLGVATLPTDATNDTTLVEQADKALYAAKTGGRNRVCTANDRRPGMATA